MYLFYADGVVRYVGETGSLCQRTWQHAKAIERHQLSGIYLHLPNITGPFRMIVEEFLIAAFKPELNVRCKNRLTDNGMRTYIRAAALVLSVEQLQAINEVLVQFHAVLSEDCWNLIGSMIVANGTVR